MAANFGIDEIALKQFTDQMADKFRAHLNEVSDQVYESHAGQPAEEVLDRLMELARTSSYEPKADGLRPAAEAISAGKCFVFVP